MKCILCKSARVAQSERVKASDLIALYKKNLSVDTSEILTQDIIYWHCEDCDLLFFTLENGEIPCGDNAFYNAINHLEWYYFSDKQEYRYAARFISESDKVLEVGCGKAAFSNFLPNPKHYTGLELSTEAKAMAQKLGVNIENIAVEDFAKAHGGEFDIACSFQVLEHTANPRGFLSAQIEALRGGGNHTILARNA